MSKMQGHHWSSQKALAHGVSEKITLFELEKKRPKMTARQNASNFEPNTR